MKFSGTSIASCIAFAACASSGVLASLQHTDNIVFQQLADLTRSEADKHHPDKPFGSIEVNSRDLGYSRQGVAWKVTKQQSAGGETLSEFKEDSHQIAGLEPLLRGAETVADAEDNGSLSSLRDAALQALQAAEASFQTAASSFSSVFQFSSESMGKRQRGGGSKDGGTFKPIKPPSFPLAVKGPYLNAWAPAGQYLAATPPNHVGNGGSLAGQAPAFWTSQYGADGDYRLGWNGLIRVDNVTYQWMGDAFGNTVRAGDNAEQLSAEYTSTKTIYNFSADGVKFIVTFMTPIWPEDFVRQSLPLSYVYFELDRKSSAGRSVQSYIDIDERWVTAHVQEFDITPYYQEFKDLKGVARWQIQRRDPQVYTEFRQRAEWGSTIWAARDRPALYARNNNNVVTQSEFLQTGILTNNRDVVGGPQNSFAYSVDFDANSGDNTALFAIGHMRSPYVNYVKASGKSKNPSCQQDRYGLWAANFSSFDEAITFFVDDFDNAWKHCTALDEQIDSDSRAVVGGGEAGEQYSAITQLSVRQAMAGIEWTISKTEKGDYNTSDLLIFLKEISSNGDMSTVDVFFPQFPLLTYLNPEILRLVMLPIFEYTESGLYPNKWCVHDLGVYPNAFGHNDGNDEPMQVEESGNMILMTLHWAQLVGKKIAIPFLKAHYKIMAQWADFLIQDSLIPASQLSTDDFAGVLANQTNLAIKGIEGIAAMGEIANLIGMTTNASRYQNISEAYIKQWQKFAVAQSRTHTKLAYQDESSWGTLYNLFGDRLLNLKLVPKAIYDLQDGWYPRVVEEWGVPLDSRHNWTKSDWQMFASATSASSSVRDLFIKTLYKFYADGRTDSPMTDIYETTTGDFSKPPFDPYVHFQARPVVGGHFMHLAIAKADKANGIDKSGYQYAPPAFDVLNLGNKMDSAAIKSDLVNSNGVGPDAHVEDQNVLASSSGSHSTDETEGEEHQAQMMKETKKILKAKQKQSAFSLKKRFATE